MTVDLPRKVHRLVPGRRPNRDLGERRRASLLLVAGENEDKPVSFAARIMANGERGLLPFRQIRNPDHFAGFIVTPRMVGAEKPFSRHHAKGKRNLAMGAPVLEREKPPAFGPR